MSGNTVKAATNTVVTINEFPGPGIPSPAGSLMSHRRKNNGIKNPTHVVAAIAIDADAKNAVAPLKAAFLMTINIRKLNS